MNKTVALMASAVCLFTSGVCLGVICGSKLTEQKALRVMRGQTPQVIKVGATNILEALQVAQILWLEARGESTLGRKAVASVIWNRSKEKSQSFVSVITADDWYGKKMTDRDEFYECVDIALDMYNGTFRPLDPKWNAFVNPDLASPSWVRELKRTTKIDRHKFGYLQGR